MVLQNDLTAENAESAEKPGDAGKIANRKSQIINHKSNL